MFCPKCGTPCDDQSLYCGSCGNSLPSEPVVFGELKKGSHLPPVIIMAVMLVIGLVCYFLFPKNAYDADVPATAPQAQEWYAFVNGTFHFYPQHYEGGASLTVPDTIESMPVLRIGESCFYDSDMLEEIILPQSLIEIGDSAFEGCDSLRGIYIPETVFRIGSRAFADCTALEAVYINDSIQTIEADAFSGCDQLHHIFFSGTADAWSDLYSGEISVFTYVYCSDGILRQGPVIP